MLMRDEATLAEWNAASIGADRAPHDIGKLLPVAT
jgi:hypothetical protein